MTLLGRTVMLLLVGVLLLLAAPAAEAQTSLVMLSAPCRVVDTRNPAGPTGGPALSGGASRSFLIAGNCGIPPTAMAAAFQFTTLTPTGQGYLTVYPSDASLTTAALLQFGPGQSAIVTNTANLQLSTTGAISAFISATPVTVHLIIDVYGYFDPAS